MEPSRVYIGAEVGRIGRLASTIARLQCVAGIDESIPSGIAHEHTHGNKYVAGGGSIVHIRQSNPDRLRVSDSEKGLPSPPRRSRSAYRRPVR